MTNCSVLILDRPNKSAFEARKFNSRNFGEFYRQRYGQIIIDMFIQKLEVSFKKLLIFVKTLEVRILSDILVVNFTEKRFSPAAPGYYQASALTSSFLLYYFATVI